MNDLINNKARLIHVAKKLGSLRNQLVFVGGSVIELFLDLEYRFEPRISYDVDVVVEVYSYFSFAQIEQALRACGFTNDISDGIICRWEIDNIKVDVMPVDPKILGFSNRWYEAVVKNAQQYSLEKTLEILLITAPYLLATKLEAFSDRGNQDFLGSHDLEDIITLLDGRKSIVDEIRGAEQSVKAYLATYFKRFLGNVHFIDAIPGHLALYGPVVEQRTERMKKIISSIAEL